jgi:hypothetical protein
VNARVAFVTAQRDRVVASYAVLGATGALAPQILGLKIKRQSRRFCRRKSECHGQPGTPALCPPSIPC